MAYANVKDLMAAICDAIREKEGSSDLIPHQDLPERIKNIGIVYFYNFGDECVDVTGGWTIDGWSNYWSDVPLVEAEKLEDCLYLSPTNNQRRFIGSNSSIDFSNYRNVYIKVRVDDVLDEMFEFVTSKSFTYGNNIKPNATELYYQDEKYSVYKMNVTNISSNVYLKLYNWGANIDRKVYAIWAD